MELKYYIGKRVRIKLLEGERSFYYSGVLEEASEEFFVIMEVKEGRCAKPISKILNIVEIIEWKCTKK